MNLDQASSLTRPVGSDGSEKSFQHFIDGAFVASADGKAFENRRPHDGSLIGHVAEGGRAEVDAAVSAARAALDGPWAALSVDERSDLIRGVANGITKRFDDFVAARSEEHTSELQSLMRISYA